MHITVPLVKVHMPPKHILLPQLEKVLYGGVIAEGEYVYEFEKKFAEHYGFDNPVATSSGTAALHMALILAGVDRGDEVITTAMTAEPTNIAILHAGAMPVFADVDAETGNISADSIAEKITKSTKAVCVVHYAGYPVELNKIRDLCNREGLKLIEDCAHALGAVYENNSVGKLGDFSIFSFQAIKHITTVEGGMLCVKNPEFIEEAKKLRWFGLTKGVARADCNIQRCGYKYNMNNVTAAIGLVQLDYVDGLIELNRKNAHFFNERLARVPGLEIGKILPNTLPSYWLYTLLADESESVERCLLKVGVQAAKLHKPNHWHDVFRSSMCCLPNLDLFYKKLIHIPCGWWVSEEDSYLIVDVLSKG